MLPPSLLPLYCLSEEIYDAQRLGERGAGTMCNDGTTLIARPFRLEVGIDASTSALPWVTALLKMLRTFHPTGLQMPLLVSELHRDVRMFPGLFHRSLRGFGRASVGFRVESVWFAPREF